MAAHLFSFADATKTPSVYRLEKGEDGFVSFDKSQRRNLQGAYAYNPYSSFGGYGYGDSGYGPFDSYDWYGYNLDDSLHEDYHMFNYGYGLPYAYGPTYHPYNPPANWNPYSNSNSYNDPYNGMNYGRRQLGEDAAAADQEEQEPVESGEPAEDEEEEPVEGEEDENEETGEDASTHGYPYRWWNYGRRQLGETGASAEETVENEENAEQAPAEETVENAEEELGPMQHPLGPLSPPHTVNGGMQGFPYPPGTAFYHPRPGFPMYPSMGMQRHPVFRPRMQPYNPNWIQYPNPGYNAHVPPQLLNNAAEQEKVSSDQ